MPNISDILRDFVVPALIVAAAFAIGWWPGGKGRDGRWIGAIAVSAAFAAAYCAIGGTPRWPPGTGDASYWLIWLAAPTALLGWLDALLRPPTWLRAGLLLVLMRIAAAIIIAPLVPRSGDSAMSTLWLMQISLDVVALAATVWWLAWETLAVRPATGGMFTPVLLVVVLAGAAAILGLSNNVKPSQVVVALAGTAIVAVLAAWRWQVKLDRGAMLAWSVPLPLLLLFVHFYSYTEPPAVCVVLLLATPLLAFAGDLPMFRDWRPGWRWTVRLAPVVLALAAAAGMTARAFASSPVDQGQQSGQQDGF